MSFIIFQGQNSQVFEDEMNTHMDQGWNPVIFPPYENKIRFFHYMIRFEVHPYKPKI